jgi:hypothetical protein
MVTRRVVLMAPLLLGFGGCNVLEGYYYEPEHFSFATVREKPVGASLERTVKNIKMILKEDEMPIREIKMGKETAQVWASKGGLQYVFDVKSAGEHGCTVRLEIDQVGNDGEAMRLMNQLSMMPE